MEFGYGASGVLKLLIPGRQGIGRVCLVMSNKIKYDLLDASLLSQLPIDAVLVMADRSLILSSSSTTLPPPPPTLPPPCPLYLLPVLSIPSPPSLSPPHPLFLLPCSLFFLPRPLPLPPPSLPPPHPLFILPHPLFLLPVLSSSFSPVSCLLLHAFTLCTHWFREITEHVLVIQIQFGRCEILQDPRELQGVWNTHTLHIQTHSTSYLCSVSTLSCCCKTVI